MAATAAWRDEMQGVARSQGLFSLTRDATQQFARQAPSHAGCGQIGRSLSCTAWHRSPGYDLRRTRRDLPDLIRNAAHGGIDQRFLRAMIRKISAAVRMKLKIMKYGSVVVARYILVDYHMIDYAMFLQEFYTKQNSA